MVTPRPLKLKSQVAAAGKRAVAELLPIARVWVDTGVFHLDTPFDYWVPEHFSLTAVLGVRVEVEFGNTVHEGIILERTESSPSNGNLKQIIKVLSVHPVATSETLELFRLVARRWAGAPYDILRSAIPPRIASVDKEESALLPTFSKILSKDKVQFEGPKSLLQKDIRAFWALPPSRNISEMIGHLVIERAKRGQVLLITSDERQLLAIEAAVIRLHPKATVARLDGHISRSDRYRNFLRTVQGNANIILGLRGAIFTPLSENATIILLHESSNLLHEPRSPGWNARDVALIRATQSKTNLIFAGFAPSLEIARLMETGWLSQISSKVRFPVIASPQIQGELLPSKAFGVVRDGLKRGPVLFLVPRKGYGNAVLCSKCRNISLCQCGGRLQQTGANEIPKCALCATSFPSWRCVWCQNPKIYIAARGIDRFSEEIGKSFPSFPLINSSGEHIVETVPDEPSLILSTPGALPQTPFGYSAVLLLEGLRFFGHSELRSTEIAREHFFYCASQVSPTGRVFVAIDDAHPIVAALSRWDSTPMVKLELQEREELKFPPYFRFIAIEIDQREATALHAGLLQAQNEQRISDQIQITNSRESGSQNSRITLAVPIGVAQSLVDFLHELQRRRSISRKGLFSIRVDPYSLT